MFRKMARMFRLGAETTAFALGIRAEHFSIYSDMSNNFRPLLAYHSRTAESPPPLFFFFLHRDELFNPQLFPPSSSSLCVAFHIQVERDGRVRYPGRVGVHLQSYRPPKANLYRPLDG